MNYTRTFILILCLTLCHLNAAAQSFETNGIRMEGLSSTNSYLYDMSNPVRDDRINMENPAPEYGKKSDDQMKELEKEIEERKWSTDQDAWERATALDTKIAYQKYVHLYPTGFHKSEAEKKIIDFEIDDILNGKYEALPMMKCIEEDDNSPTSTISILNDTEYPLTVWYSGIDSKSIVISPHGKAAVTLNNGYYRIAAAVPNAKVRPYAGEEYVGGGQFETGFCIIYGRP